MVLHKQQTAGETFTANVRGIPMSKETPSCYIISSHINPSIALAFILHSSCCQSTFPPTLSICFPSLRFGKSRERPFICPALCVSIKSICFVATAPVQCLWPLLPHSSLFPYRVTCLLVKQSPPIIYPPQPLPCRVVHVIPLPHAVLEDSY